MADWSQKEVEIIVADYFSMLTSELVNSPINKSKNRNQLLPLLNNRSNGSIEYKHRNISAVLIKLGLPFIKGYKPMYNYQRILESAVIIYLSTQKSQIEPKFELFADSKIFHSVKPNFEAFVDSPPVHEPLVKEPVISYDRIPIKINYLEREQQNSALGLQGEMLAMEYERWRLIKLGQKKWANEIQWVSQTDDGAGFDILSKNDNGTERYIEVKTTKLSKETPIFFSKNEFGFSSSNRSQYHLYRLFNFSNTPKLFSVSGSFDEFCSIEPIQYKGYF